MPDVYLTTSQRAVSLTEQIGSGGEGDVYALPGDRSRVCKIYHASVLQTRGDELACKLAAMVASPPHDPYAAMGKPVFAWPVELLADAATRAQCVGFVMPRISYSHPLHVLYSAAGRRSLNFPKNVQPYYVIVATARNLALAFDKLHARGYVMADVNEENLRFRVDATVSFIDNDSFQVRDSTTRQQFLSGVMKPEYWPVDSVKLAGKKKPLTPAHDCFCLAVFLFRLLMNGAHPFYGIAPGDADPPGDVDNIAAGRFPYVRWYAGGLTAPLQYPSFNALPRAVRNNFIRCFTRGTYRPSARPTAAEWLDTLEAALPELVECSRKHLYFRSAHTCPWCEIQDARTTCQNGHKYDRRQGECPECAHAHRRSAYRAGASAPAGVAPSPASKPQPVPAQQRHPARHSDQRMPAHSRLAALVAAIARRRVVWMAAALVVAGLIWLSWSTGWTFPAHRLPSASAASSVPSNSGRGASGIRVESRTRAINLRDGARMVLIPAGSFQMGEDDQNDNPPHAVTLSAYWIYKNDVTVGEYKLFCKATGREMPPAPDFDPKWSQNNHPVVNVTWDDAEAYASWAGGELPTEAQWEKAARGTGSRRYPWGNLFDSSKLWCSVDTNRRGTAPVGKYGISAYGCTDMAGNVWQWCLDSYDAAFWKNAQGTDLVNNDANSIYSVLRGGGWNNDNRLLFRSALRMNYLTNSWLDHLGFRCALRGGSR